MPDYASTLLGLIDSRIDQAQARTTKMGTVQQRNTTGTAAVVSFDGSNGIGQPVKCFEGVVVDVGDRVGLIKYEGDWIITGNYTLRSWADQITTALVSSSSTTTSSTFVDAPTSPTVAFTKRRDVTNLEILVGMSLWTTAQPVVVEVGVSITAPLLAPFDTALYHRAINVASVHLDVFGGALVTASAPAGGYIITGRWRRVSGTGTLTQDSNDSTTIIVREVLP